MLTAAVVVIAICFVAMVFPALIVWFLAFAVIVGALATLAGAIGLAFMLFGWQQMLAFLGFGALLAALGALGTWWGERSDARARVETLAKIEALRATYQPSERPGPDLELWQHWERVLNRTA